MQRGQSFNLPLNKGGGVDARAGAVRRAAQAATNLHARRPRLSNTEQALQFKNFERESRHSMKIRDEHGRTIMTSDGLSRYCHICSESTSVFIPTLTAVHHRHEDSAEWRCSVNNGGALYPCHTCKISYHSFDIVGLNMGWTNGRLPVLATSSTLFQWQGARHRTNYSGDPFHIERVSVAGATVRSLAHAVEVDYFNLGIPLDLLICVGLNDVIKGRSALDIMCDYAMLQEALEWRLPTSTLSICTLPLPPKLCRLPNDLSWRPTNFENKLDVLIELNQKIVQTNRNNSRRWQRPTDMAPTFHTRGLRTAPRQGSRPVGPSNLLASVRGHRHSNWRESAPHQMLHLNELIMCSMGRATVNFFRAFYGMIPRVPRNFSQPERYGGGSRNRTNGGSRMSRGGGGRNNGSGGGTGRGVSNNDSGCDTAYASPSGLPVCYS